MITNNAKNDLYELLRNNGAGATSSSNILPNPSYKERVMVDYVSKLPHAFSTYKVLDIKIYKDIKVVIFLKADYRDSIIGCFDLENNLIEYFDKVKIPNPSTGLDEEHQLDSFIKWDIDKNGIIYGVGAVFRNDVAQRVSFFRFSDILSQVGILDKADIDVFYSGHVDLMSEHPKDPAKPTENIMGYQKLTLVLFNIGGSNDGTIISNIKSSFNEDNTYIISFWVRGLAENIRVIKIKVPLGAKTQRECDWIINEDIKLVKGQAATVFKDISGLGAAAGKKTVSTGVTTSEEIVGSLLIETSKETTGNTFVKQTKSIAGTASTVRWKEEDLLNSQQNNFGKDYATEFNLEKIITDYNTFIASLPATTKNISPISKIDIVTYSGSQSISIPLDTATMTKIIANGNLKLKYTIYFTWISTPRRDHRSWYKEKIEIISTGAGGNVNIDIQNSNIGARGVVSTNHNWLMNWDVNFNTDVTYELQQTASSKATTQMLSLVSNSSDIEYRVSQVENNIYKGSKPVFINLTKAYVPLLSRDSGKFDIYEFDSATKTTTEIDKFFNTHTPEGQADNSDFVVELTNVGSGGIVELRIDGVVNTDYTLAGNTLTIHHISKNKTVNITYKSTVGTPKKITINTSTNSEDMFIAGIDNTEELTTLDKTIVGVGDDGTNDFGMIIYKSKSNIDDDSVAEDVQALGTQLKHIAGARQNDLVYIFGYNKDFTQEVRWVSIYPESFKPYTYTPYDDKKKEFAVERLNGSSSNELKHTNFDKEFLNVSSSGNTIIASTEAKQTDANYKGQEVVSVFGHTNKKIFEKTITDYEKTRQETRELNFSINTKVIDRVNGDITRQEASNTLGQVFSLKNAGAADNIGIKLREVYQDGTTKDSDIQATDFTISNDLLQVSTVIDRGTKQLSKVQLVNKKGELLSEAIPCKGGAKVRVSWDIKIQSNNNVKGGSA